MSVIIRLQLLPLSAAAADIRAFFNGLRIPEGSVHIVGGPEGDAFIGFASDEDARQAMRRDRGQIHGVEIKLYLSSRAEMNEVITQARAGLRIPKTSPAPVETKVESIPTWNGNENVAPIPTSQPVYTQADPAPSAFVPDTSDYNKPAYMRMPEVGQQNQNTEQPYNGIRPPTGGYQANFASQSEVETPRQYHAGPPPSMPPRNSAAPPAFFNKNMKGEKQLLPTPHFRQQPAPDAQDTKMADILAKIPAHLRPPHGIPPPHLRHLFPGLGAPPSMPPKTGSMPELVTSHTNSVPDRQPLRNGAFTSEPSTSLPVRNESWRDSMPKANGTVRNESAWSNNSNGPSTGRKPLMNNPSMDRPPFQNGPQPNRAVHYFELSRLPNDMLRPSVLEEFIRPSVPLTLSSVKVVYDRSGILLHTLLRLESEIDAANLMRKDGQHGIKIRPSNADVFNAAVDGPVAPPANTGLVDSGRRNDRDRDRERRETRQRSPPRRRRSRSPARNQRDGRQRTRSRSRERRDNRSSRDSREKDSQRRSPTERRGRQEPNRWCLQLTNVPFRGTEEQIQEWLSQRGATPSKISRTFYSDGNASDRWVVEFETEQAMEKAFDVREVLCGRTIKMKYINNDVADEYLAIEDVYGKTRQKDNELNQLAELQMQHLNGAMQQPTNFYPTPPIRGRGGPPIFPPGRGRGGPPPGHPYHMPPFMPPQPLFRGGPRGRGFGPPGGMPRGGPPRPPFFRGRGYHNAAPFVHRPPSSVGSHENLVIYEKPVEMQDVAKQLIEEVEEDPIVELPEYPDDLLSIIGPHGCVIVCNGFPPDITLQEVVSFFEGYDVNEGSIRIKMGDDGVATGECMLAAISPEVALKAVDTLNGKKLRDHKVSMKAPQ